MRSANVSRKTAETDVNLTLNLDGGGKADVCSGSGFFDHMLRLFAAHGGFDLTLKCVGDTEVDFHHSAEDIGIALGSAFKTALSDKRGITRYGDVILPMDEALVLAAVDLSGRSNLSYCVNLPCAAVSDTVTEVRTVRVGSFDTELVEEFFTAFVRNAECSLHLRLLAGSNVHHIVECVFKAFARALKTAVALDSKNADKIPSTKGSL